MSWDYDVAVVGSGFGGATTALRLAEKGYTVAVLEAGRRLAPRDLFAARKSMRDYLWRPEVGMRGFFWVRTFKDVWIIGASGVGGGSIAWAAVMLEPSESFYADPAWSQLADWRGELAEHYTTAARMLGVVTNKHMSAQDDALRKAAAAVGAEDTFGPVPLAVYFGEGPRVTTADPFFDGEGPERTGCQMCGGCIAGCPYGSKNSLDLNYLHLAERRGARILPQHQVDAVVPLPGGGYRLTSRDPLGRGPTARRPAITAKRVVLSGGVLGTLDLLMHCRDDLGTLPGVSSRLGHRVRTNSEALTGVLADDPKIDLLDGPSISSDFHPDAVTHVTQNRALGGSRVMRPQLGPLIDGHDPRRRALGVLRAIVADPIGYLRIVFARNFDARFLGLTVMQNVDNELRFRWRRSPVRPWRRVLGSEVVEGKAAPTYLPVANQVTRAVAEALGGKPMNLLPESMGGMSTTAHVLGGASIGGSAESGVVDINHEVFGHPGLFVADASVIPANVGVNPSLTITAMAERFAARWPDRAAELPLASGRPPVLPAKMADLRALFAVLPVPVVEDLTGDWDVSYLGPRVLRMVAPHALGALGLPGWAGKRFTADGSGTNRLHDGTTRLVMTVRANISRVDGEPVAAITYGHDAPLPWPRVIDEVRQLDADRLLCVTVFDVPGGNRNATPFLLTRVAD